jgi:CheY-like chemotaxis protein
MSPSAGRSPTCLCVELDPDFYYLIQSYAERSGLRAAHVAHGAEVLPTIRQDKPSVIFLEPEHRADESTWEVLRALKADPEAAPIPIILFSWLDEEEKARSAGAAVYVRKPVMYVDFLDALAAAGIRHGNQEK